MAETVRVELADVILEESVTLAVLNEACRSCVAYTPWKLGEALRLTVPENSPRDLTVIVDTLLVPGATVKFDGVESTSKSGGTTKSANVAVCDRLLVPFTARTEKRYRPNGVEAFVENVRVGVAG